MVFQDYALYPQMTVFDNLAFGLRRRKVPRDGDRAARGRGGAACWTSSRCWSAARGSSPAARRSASRSGRALVREPQVFLMDEPLSNLDAKLRTQTRGEIRRLQQEVAHDHGLRHPRPGRGDDDGRPDRGHEPRRARAGRDAGGALRAARRTASSPASSARRRCRSSSRGRPRPRCAGAASPGGRRRRRAARSTRGRWRDGPDRPADAARSRSSRRWGARRSSASTSADTRLVVFEEGRATRDVGEEIEFGLVPRGCATSMRPAARRRSRRRRAP